MVGCLAQGLITDAMAIGIVNAFEFVEIDKQQDKKCLLFLKAIDFSFKMFDAIAAVGQARECIVHGQIAGGAQNLFKPIGNQMDVYSLATSGFAAGCGRPIDRLAGAWRGRVSPFLLQHPPEDEVAAMGWAGRAVIC